MQGRQVDESQGRPCRPNRDPAPPGILVDADEEVILRFARYIEGQRPCEYRLPARRFGPKGEFGCLVELIFGLDCGNRPEPDFRAAQIELKSTKLELIGGSWKVGERTSLHSIDFVAVGNEEWATATVKPKLARILFCFYRWVPGRPPATWTIDKMFFWEPDDLQWRYLKEDWLVIRNKCRTGQAHHLSESDTRVLGAATKSAKGAKRRQMAEGPDAPQRAFTLKQPFVRALYEIATGKPKLESLTRVLGLTKLSTFERDLLAKLAPYEGRTVAELARNASVTPSVAKNYSQIVIRRTVKRLLGLRDANAKIREFLEFGIEMHIVPLRSSGMPKEALSFPAFRYKGLLAEDWDSSDLKARLNKLFLVPIWEPRPRAPAGEWVLGHPFFWSPDERDLEVIRAEWEMFRREIRAGKGNALTPASQTKIIHVRPHARNSSDTDVAPIVGPVTKKSFWLNPRFMAELVRRNSGERPVKDDLGI